MARTYQVDAWRGIEPVGFTTRTRADAVLRDATRFVVDQGADRVWVRASDQAGRAGEVVAIRNSLVWTKCKDPRLYELLEKEGEFE